MGQGLVECARWFLLFIIVAAVVLWGTTRPWTMNLIARALLLDLFVFITGLVLIGRKPRLVLWMISPLTGILLMGWLMALNAFPGPGGLRILLERVPGHVSWLPASIDHGISIQTMILVSGLLGAMCISCDLASNRIWLLRLWRTTALTGAGMVFLGLAQRWTHAKAIYWNLYENAGEYFFGVYRYHANAGALINLTLPLLAGLSLLSIFDSRRVSGRPLWITATLATIAGSFVNVSRASYAITILLSIAIIIAVAHRFSRKNPAQYLAKISITSFVALAILIPVTLSFGIEKSLYRWTHPGSRSAFFGWDRIRTSQAIVQSLLPRSIFWGSGPGTFEQSFAAVNSQRDSPVAGRWDMAHNDYLQTLAEWGVIGSVFWAFLLGGGIVIALKRFRSGTSLTMDVFNGAGILALGGVLIHALVDFPLQIASIQLFTSCLTGALWGIDSSRARSVSDGLDSTKDHQFFNDVAS
jgi:O-antigen ligase